MSIFLNKDSKVIVQGITGGEGTKHTALMLKAGTNIVGGVNARKAGTTVTHGEQEIKVYGTVAEAKAETGLPAWTPERIQTLARERGASVVTEIVRAAPLRSVEGTPAQSFTPAPQQGRPEPTAPTMAFRSGQSDTASEPSFMASVSRLGEATEPQSR